MISFFVLRRRWPPRPTPPDPLIPSTRLVRSTGAAINLANGGTLSYTGVRASSNRTWSANGAVGISNDGTGALALGGDFAFDPLNPNPEDRKSTRLNSSL